MTDARINDLLVFWFGEMRDDPVYYQERARLWFGHNLQLD